jgi:hypothetical protein
LKQAEASAGKPVGAEIDGLYALGRVRPKNRKEDRVDRRLPENQSPDRVVVMAIRERRKGGQSVTRIAWRENPQCAWGMMRMHVEENSSVFADEHPAYNAFDGHSDDTRVNHGCPAHLASGPYSIRSRRSGGVCYRMPDICGATVERQLRVRSGPPVSCRKRPLTA